MYNGILQASRTILRDEGFTAFWKGNIPAEFLYLAYGGIQFLSYRETNVYLSSFGLTASLPDGIKGAICGATSGGIATAATYPLDLLRTRFAAQGVGEKRVYRSIYHAVTHIYQTEGPRGYFRGLGAGLSQILPNMGLFFGTYTFVHQLLEYSKEKSLIRHPPTGKPWEDAFAGATASLVAKTGVFPLDLVRKRLQVQGPCRGLYVNGEFMPIYEGGVVRTMFEVARLEGIRGLYKGLGVALIKAVPTSAITMWTFGRALKLVEWWEQR